MCGPRTAGAPFDPEALVAKIDMRQVVITALAAVVLTAVARAVAPKVPLLNRVANYL